MRIVPVGSIRIGSQLGKTIYNDKGNILLKNGVELTDSLISKLKENNIISVYIDDDYSTEEIDDVISPELRNRAVHEIKAVFGDIRNELTRQVGNLKKNPLNLKKRLAKIADLKFYEKINSVLEEILDELTKNKDAMYGLVDIKSMNNFIYQHSVQVTILSLLVGISMKLDAKSLKNLAIGAMLHDIGLSFLEKKLMLYSETFDLKQKAKYEEHCLLGYEFIKENSAIEIPGAIGILQHHERFDGSGYPKGLVGESIHLFSRIISVANVYDTMTSGVYGKQVFPNEALEYIMGNSGFGRRFDLNISSIFVRKIIPYPVGTYLKLSNGNEGIVVANHDSHPLRPSVKIIGTDLPILNLMQLNHLNITITKVLFEFDN